MARQNARRLGRDHVLAAVVLMVRRIAGHRPVTLHRLLVKRHGLAFSELHQQQYAQRHNERCDLPKHYSGPSEASSSILGFIGGACGKDRSRESRSRKPPPGLSAPKPLPACDSSMNDEERYRQLCARSQSPNFSSHYRCQNIRSLGSFTLMSRVGTEFGRPA